MSSITNPVPKVPKKFCGLWIAWNHAQTKIVGSGKTLPEDEMLDEVGLRTQGYE